MSINSVVASTDSNPSVKVHKSPRPSELDLKIDAITSIARKAMFGGVVGVLLMLTPINFLALPVLAFSGVVLTVSVLATLYLSFIDMPSKIKIPFLN